MRRFGSPDGDCEKRFFGMFRAHFAALQMVSVEKPPN
jgi:hypothetical protein